MNSDEAKQLYNPNSEDEIDVDDANNEAEPQIVDAANIVNGANATNSNTSAQDAENHSFNNSNNETPPTAETLPPTGRRWFILEPAVFFIFLGISLTGAVYQNQILYQTCTVVYKRNASDCEPLLGISRETEEAKALEKEIQPYTAHIIMTRSILESVIPAFVSLFIGPWSDKFGRRPIIVSIFTGYLIGGIILTTLGFIATKVAVSPWFFLLSSMPSVLSGGQCALVTGVYCYISDVAKDKQRAARMVLNEASILSGVMIGNVASGYIYAKTNTYTMFGISSILMGCSLLYVCLFVTESLKPEQIHGGSKIREFFRIDLVKDLVHTCFARRPSYDRAIIWLTITALTIAVFTMEGDSNVTYLFVRTKFDWTVKDFTLFNAIRIVVQIIGSIVGLVFLRKVMKASIITMLMLAFSCSVLESTVRATAVYWWEMYLGTTLGFMRGVMGPMARAILSHVAPAGEVGKIFAFTTSVESISPLGAAPLYTMVYEATLNTEPAAFNYISASLFLLCYTLIATIYGIQKSLGTTESYAAISS